METPYWQLHVVYNSLMDVSLTKDTEREEIIRKMKRSWFDANSDRFNNSKILR